MGSQQLFRSCPDNYATTKRTGRHFGTYPHTVRSQADRRVFESFWRVIYLGFLKVNRKEGLELLRLADLPERHFPNRGRPSTDPPTLNEVMCSQVKECTQGAVVA